MERENSSVESILSFGGVCRFTTNFRKWRKKIRKREEVQEIERESQVEEKHSHGHDYGDDMKDSNILSRSACADDVTLTRLNEKETVRATLMWMSVEVVSGVRIVQCHANIDVVIDVRVMKCHAIIDVVIGVRVMLCHQVIDQSTIMNFPLRVPILILLSCCINSSSLFPVAIVCTLLHRENTSFEVWYLQFQLSFWLSLQQACPPLPQRPS